MSAFKSFILSEIRNYHMFRPGVTVSSSSTIGVEVYPFFNNNLNEYIEQLLEIMFRGFYTKDVLVWIPWKHIKTIKVVYFYNELLINEDQFYRFLEYEKNEISSNYNLDVTDIISKLKQKYTQVKKITFHLHIDEYVVMSGITNATHIMKQIFLKGGTAKTNAEHDFS